MVTNKIIYKCDICNNESEDADIFFTNILVPVKTYEHMSSSYSIAYRKLDMCKKCKERYENAVFQHFGVFKKDSCGFSSFVPSKTFATLAE